MDYMTGNQENLRKYIGDDRQLAGITEYVLSDGPARGVRVAEVNNGCWRFQVLLDRGLDIGAAFFRGIPLPWLAPAGFVHPAYYNENQLGWLRSWGGGLLTGCGLRHVGAPDTLDDEAMGLHGRLSHAAGRHCRCVREWRDGNYHLSVTGEMRECRLFGENLALTRTIATTMNNNTITITDTIENRAYRPSHLMLLYHINPGYPLLTEKSFLRAVDHEVIPRDDVAASGLSEWRQMQKPTPGYQEQCFYHLIPPDSDGINRIALVNPELKLAFTVAYRARELPYLIQWKQMGESEYVLGLEPANCHVQGIRKEKEYGTLTELQPGESLETLVEITVEDI